MINLPTRSPSRENSLTEDIRRALARKPLTQAELCTALPQHSSRQISNALNTAVTLLRGIVRIRRANGALPLYALARASAQALPVRPKRYQPVFVPMGSEPRRAQLASMLEGRR